MITDKEITDALKKFNSNKGETAKYLNIKPGSLSRRLKNIKELSLKKKSKKKNAKTRNPNRS